MKYQNIYLDLLDAVEIHLIGLLNKHISSTQVIMDEFS